MKNRIIIHADFDYFYAQCEEIRKPQLRTVPIAVCVFSDRGGDSGAIATANYTARNYGVKSGMSITIAKRKLESVPESVFLPTDFNYYSDMSQKAMDIMSEFADIFEYVGKDEAYLDITAKSKESFDHAAHIGQQIKNTIREGTKLTCSVGITPNKLISKIASDFKKPDGLTVVRPENVSTFLEPLKIRDVPGIGKKTEVKLESMDDLRIHILLLEQFVMRFTYFFTLGVKIIEICMNYDAIFHDFGTLKCNKNFSILCLHPWNSKMVEYALDLKKWKKRNYITV